MRSNKEHFLITRNVPESVVSEAFRAIRTSIKYSSFDLGDNAVLFTSSVKGEGKTSIVANLGILTAQDGKKTLLIDGDLRRPNLHFIFNINNRFGLSSLLSGYSSFEDSIVQTEIKNLSIIPAGPIQPNPSELLGSTNLEDLIFRCKTEYDVILIDAPPLLSITDASILARVADRIILVIRSFYAKKDQIVKAEKILQLQKEKVLGIIMNDKSIK